LPIFYCLTRVAVRALWRLGNCRFGNGPDYMNAFFPAFIG
jgi:hypothetical protein